ncbi:MAG: LytR C-terminal domain-containing protein [Propionibacteriales bacterium]|nr:LytR C-terminal domain-containing protein [Propionibacteriales bacterium]
MALSSGITLASATLVVTAGVGLVVATSNASEDPAPRQSARTTPATVTSSTRTPAAPERHTDRRPRKHKAIDVDPLVLVDVYNNSGITGLAAEKAAVLQGAGWNVAATDNWYGDIPSTTVYYPTKLRRDATRLSRLLHVSRLRPAVAPMQFDRLTVIFTSS